MTGSSPVAGAPDLASGGAGGGASAPGGLPELGLQLLQRDWLSANHIVFAPGDTPGGGPGSAPGGAPGSAPGSAPSATSRDTQGAAPATVVDTGYARHSELTLALIEHALAGRALGRIVNTHLHSDHCGGNRALQARWQVETLIPAASFEAVKAWDAARLSYRSTGQFCEQFRVDGGLVPGQTLQLGPAEWQVHAAPGHDPDAVLLFEPQTRTLISGDALWEDRLAIIFPEIDGEPGFGPARATLAMIEALQPRRVVPGHGAAFEDVAAALAASRQRLAAFERDPARHVRHAARALAMFHMMEIQRLPRGELEAWLRETPIFQRMAAQLAPSGGAAAWAHDLAAGLLGDGLLVERQGALQLAAQAGG